MGGQWTRTNVAVGLLMMTLSVGGIGLALQAADVAPPELNQYYGFLPLELFKLEDRSANMLAADMNHDSLTDLILVDNGNSRIDILIQRKTPAEAPAALSKGVNDVPNDRRFEHQKLSVDKAVAALTSGDFDHDGRTDLAYLGIPDRLIIKYQPETGGWVRETSIRLPDLALTQWSIAAGDLNHDGQDDLVVLGKQVTYLLFQEKGKFDAPVTLMNTSEKLGLVQIADLNGDGRADLAYLADDDATRVLCARLQSSAGQIGPEMRFDLGRTRAVAMRDLDGRPGHEVLAIHAQTGRVKVFQWEQPMAQAGELGGRLIQYGFGQTAGGRERDLALADLTGDGLIDVVATDPESAQMIVFRQVEGTGLDQGTAYPGLSGASQVRIADFDGAGAREHEVLVLSPTEKTIGVSRLEGGRLSFPQPIPIVQDPIAFDVADVDQNGMPELIYIRKERGTKTAYRLFVLRPGPEQTWELVKFGAQEGVELPIKSDPTRLVSLDANRDGKLDFLIFAGVDRPPTFLKTNAEGLPQEITGEGGGGLGNINASGLFVQGGENPRILIAQTNFAREVRLSENNRWQVVDQFNAAESAAAIAGATALQLDGEGQPEIVLVDLGVKRLRVLRREENVYRPWREVEIGAFPFKSAHVVDLNGDKKDDLLLFGGNKFGVLYTDRTDPLLRDVATYESKLDRARFADLVSGDLNGDGRADVALLDTQSQQVEIVDFHAATGFRHAVAFKVFEGKSFQEGQEGAGSEPRESLIADVTGDGRADLVLLAHDRVLIYPQDAGEETPPVTGQTSGAEKAR